MSVHVIKIESCVDCPWIIKEDKKYWCRFYGSHWSGKNISGVFPTGKKPHKRINSCRVENIITVENI